MKKRMYLMLTLVGIFAFALIGCEKSSDGIVENNLAETQELSSLDVSPQVNQKFSEHGLMAYPNGVITFEDFRATGKLLPREEAEKLTTAKQLGNTPENAIVQPLFHENGVLYTPHEYNLSGIKMEELNNTYNRDSWTIDLATFRQVTGLEQARGDYARDFGVFWIFDPLVRFYETREEKNNLGKKRSSTVRPSSSQAQLYLQKGNMLYGEWQWWSPAGYTGHTAGIISNLYASYPTGDLALKQLLIIEGIPVSGIISQSPISSGNDWKDWRSSNMTRRCVMYTNPTPTTYQRELLREFQENQLGKTWWFPLNSSSAQSSKESTNSFYCSKLQWLAYKSVMDIDLDRDGGAWVFPGDILYDDNVEYIEFGYGVIT